MKIAKGEMLIAVNPNSPLGNTTLGGINTAATVGEVNQTLVSGPEHLEPRSEIGIVGVVVDD